MLFVVVPQTLVLGVVFSMFVSAMLLLGVAGTVAPPYHLKLYVYYFYQSSGTHYSLRGCDCSHGFYCGFAVVNLNTSFSSSSWTLGASLSFKPYIKLRVLHMLFVVVAVFIVLIVVSLVLFWTVLLLGVVGILAPPYHLNLK